MREPVEETRDLLALHNMTMDNLRGAVEKAAPAESRRQARAESGESIEPGEKPLKGKHDNDKMGAVKDSLKEDLKNGKARKEDRGAFLRRATGEGLRVFEGDSIAYGYRSVRRESARENARQIQEELTELGIDAEITDGYVHWNLDGISCKRAISQAVTIERRRILISNRVSLPSKNAAGHEAFHLWGSTQAREAYANEVADNLNYSSREFVEYQAVIAEAYLGGEADLSDSTQLQKLREELFAYISGDIHEGVNDDLLRPMFHDYDAVKAAWVKLCKDNSGGEVRFQQRDSDTSGIKDQIKSHAQELSNKPVVANVQVENLDKMSIKEKRRWAENVLKSTGYKVDRQGFGTIAYEPRHINEGLNYLKQSGEIAAFAALPQVLKRGEIIERHDNHKGRNFGTVTITAPVMINGVRGNMAAVVQMTGKNHYHTHRILMPDGSTFEFRQKNSTDSKPAGATPNTDAHATPMDSVHNSSIRSLAANSQEKSSDPDIRYSLREEFSGEIDSWAEDGMPEGVRFTLGSTGPVLQGLGAIESDIYMEGDKIQKILQDHPEMTLAEIKKVPQILEDPALILKSEGRGKSGANSRLVCFGLTKAQNGQPVMTVMDLRPRENGFVVDDMQKVNSAYTKKNPMAFIQKSDVVYADKKRAIPLLRTTGLTISS